MIAHLDEDRRVRVVPGHPYSFATLQKHSKGEWDLVADAIVRGDATDADNVHRTLKLM